MDISYESMIKVLGEMYQQGCKDGSEAAISGLESIGETLELDFKPISNALREGIEETLPEHLEESEMMLRFILIENGWEDDGLTSE